MKIIKEFWPILVLIISCFTISIAWIAEYFFDILPCQMCLYQRYPYYFIIVFSIIFLIYRNIPMMFYYLTISLALLFGLFFAIWHVGIENNIFPGLTGCTNQINNVQSISELKEKILNQNIISCNEITWSFMGFSAATYNSILIIALLIMNTIFLLQKNNEKEKKH